MADSLPDDSVAAETAEPEATPLLAPRDGVPQLAVSRYEIARAAELLETGHGPFAVDAERASGFRYSNRAYLLQVRRAGAGTVLIDPVNHGNDPVTTLAPVAEVLATDEWVVHAADQDLPCLDRKSTRLNSSHPSISYAVFCLKKKKNAKNRMQMNTRAMCT